MEELDTMSVKQLKEYISSKGGSHEDCVEKKDLQARAHSLAQKPKQQAPTKSAPTNHTLDKTDFLEEDISSSDDEAEVPGSTPSTATTTTTSKRFSVFRAKKFVASKLVSGTSTGRATLMKVLGKDGDEVVHALQSICAKLTQDDKLAHVMKKDSIRFLLKTYNLLKEHKITIESTRAIQVTGQKLAEMFVREAGLKNRLPTSAQCLAALACRVHDDALAVMSPHLQPKNRDRLSELLRFFSTKEFFQAVLSRADMEEEKKVLQSATTELLLPFPTLLAGERERTKYERSKAFAQALELRKFDALMDYPQFVLALQAFLELEMGLTPKHVLRFIRSVEDFEKTTSKSLMRDRGPKIVNRFLLEKSEFSIVDGLNADLVRSTVDEANNDNECSLSTFTKLVQELKRLLRADFETQFVKTRDYQNLRQQVKGEIAALEALLVADGVM